jgi:hypothetical protein
MMLLCVMVTVTVISATYYEGKWTTNPKCCNHAVVTVTIAANVLGQQLWQHRSHLPCNSNVLLLLSTHDDDILKFTVDLSKHHDDFVPRGLQAWPCGLIRQVACHKLDEKPDKNQDHDSVRFCGPLL